MKYILDGHEIKEEPDLMAWAKWIESADKHVAKYTNGDVCVSTVFLGIDHSFSSNSEPILFETMVFGGDLNGEQNRYATWEEAARGHEEMVKRVKERTP